MHGPVKVKLALAIPFGKSRLISLIEYFGLGADSSISSMSKKSRNDTITGRL